MTESTLEDVVDKYERFRVLCVGRSGVGKSSLINKVFGIKEAHVSSFEPGTADIEKTYHSPENRFFVLHDSVGFEPGNNVTFDTVKDFISNRSKPEVKVKDRIHAIWLCTQTPTAGARVFEEGDKKLLKLVHAAKIPIVIVFTQYDKLVRMKVRAREKNPITRTMAERRGEEEADKEFQKYVGILKDDIGKIGIPVPIFVRASAPPSTSTSRQKGDVLELVNTTCDLLRPVRNQPDGDAWLIWAIAQRVSLPLKIEACVDKGISYYRQALSGAVPLVGGNLLRACLAKVHLDIVTCWNFKDENQILHGDEFKQLMLYIVQDVYGNSETTTPPDITKISQFATLVSAASANAPASALMLHAVAPTPIAPAAAILGLSFFFVKWLFDAVLENRAEVDSVMMAYIVDLICVLKEFFDFTLTASLVGETSWKVLRGAFEAYYLNDLFKRNHHSCRSASHRNLDQKGFRDEIEELVRDVKK